VDTPDPAPAPAGDPPPHPATADGPVPDVVAWAVELVRTAPWLWRGYGLLPALPVRARERALAAFGERAGAPLLTWVHRSWQSFLGPHHQRAVLDDVVEHAERSADAGRPVDAHLLSLSVPPSTARAARACLAWMALAAAAERGLTDLRGQARTEESPRPARVVADVVAVALGAPMLGTSVTAGLVVELCNRLAPASISAETPEDATLLAHVLADAVPAYLGNALVRALALRSPWPLAVGVRSGRSAATVRVGRGEVIVANGLEPDVVAVLDGDVDLLIEAASGTLLEELHEAAEQGS
jgi:hypothetical protein